MTPYMTNFPFGNNPSLKPIFIILSEIPKLQDPQLDPTQWSDCDISSAMAEAYEMVGEMACSEMSLASLAPRVPLGRVHQEQAGLGRCGFGSMFCPPSNP